MGRKTGSAKKKDKKSKSRKSRRLSIKKVLPVIGILLFIWILSGLDLSRLAKAVAQIRWPFVAATLAVGMTAIFIKSYKWKKAVDYSGLKYSTRDSFKAWLVSFAVGLITPGRVGDFYRAIYLKTSNRKPIGVCFATVFLDRIFDIIIMLFFAGLGILYLLTMYDIPWGRKLALFIGVMFVLVLIFLCLFRDNLVRRIIRPLFYRFVPEKHQKSMRKNYESFFSLFNTVMKQPSRLMVLVVIGVAGWLTAFLQLYLLALALNLDVTYLFISAIAPVINMIELIPISFSGIGTRDIALIFFLGLIGASKELAVSLSIMILITIYILALPGMIYWIRHPTMMPKKKTVKS
ncbi:MAG: lysylphosphatidylglycerol synthase transmembrane domain-containing protein [Candidatus Woesearchaeota archaeon]